MIYSEISTARIMLLHPMEEFCIDSMPKDIAEKFLERIIAVETGHATNKIEPISNDGKQWHIAIPRRRSES